jgi:hypothetical protein
MRSEAFYRLLLRALPSSFRDRHGEEMVSWFREHAAATAKHDRRVGWAGFWLVILRDLARTVVLERWKTYRSSGSGHPPRREATALDGLLQDSRVAVRSLPRRPAFVLLVLGTLALGVGAATTVYSVAHGVLLAPLPYEDPGRIVRVGKISEGRPGILSVSALDLIDLQERNRSFEALAASRPTGVTLSGEGEPELLRAAMVSSSFFETLGRHPVLGRAWEAAADEPDGPAVVVLGHGLWQRR